MFSLYMGIFYQYFPKTVKHPEDEYANQIYHGKTILIVIKKTKQYKVLGQSYKSRNSNLIEILCCNIK